MKVNQRKEIIEEIVKSGRKFNIGLEVGTKAELLAALSFDLSNDALLICNASRIMNTASCIECHKIE